MFHSAYVNGLPFLATEFLVASVAGGTRGRGDAILAQQNVITGTPDLLVPSGKVFDMYAGDSYENPTSMP